MFSTSPQQFKEEKQPQDEMNHLTGFFDLLLVIDRRENPERYGNEQKYSATQGENRKEEKI